MAELDPVLVASRLALMSALSVPESVNEGRARLRAEAMAPDAIVATVTRRLEELRALCDLADHLAPAKRPGSVG